MTSLPLTEVLKKYKTFMVVLPGCPFCNEAREILKKHQIEFKEFSCRDNELLSEDIKKKYHFSTYPKIFINEKFIGGCDDLKKYLKQQ